MVTSVHQKWNYCSLGLSHQTVINSVTCDLLSATFLLYKILCFEPGISVLVPPYVVINVKMTHKSHRFYAELYIVYAKSSVIGLNINAIRVVILFQNQHRIFFLTALFHQIHNRYNNGNTVYSPWTKRSNIATAYHIRAWVRSFTTLTNMSKWLMHNFVLTV